VEVAIDSVIKIINSIFSYILFFITKRSPKR
jgi:hypothetical protein